MTATVHRAMPRAKYDASPRRSNSQLKPMRQSPAHYKWALTHPREDTDALRFGRCADLALFEFDEFRRTVVEYRDRRAGKAWDAFEYAHAAAGHEILTQDEYARCLGVRDSVRANTKIAPYLVGETQVSIFWDAEGRPMKSRLDLVTANGCILELKTCKSAEREAFGRDAWTYGYHVQAAVYVEAWKQATGEERPFALLAVEKEAPYLAALYVVGDEAIAAGRAEFQKCLARLDECEKSGEWPGYQSIDYLELPRWSGVRDSTLHEEET